LRYTAAIQKLWNYRFSYVDYQIARLFEDLQEHLPAMLEPVPEEIAGIVSNPAWLERVARWREEGGERAEIDERWELYESAIAWWHEREIDTAYLSHGPGFLFGALATRFIVAGLRRITMIEERRSSLHQMDTSPRASRFFNPPLTASAKKCS
jgi:hypothetical protein